MYVIAIDPGAKGAYCILDRNYQVIGSGLIPTWKPGSKTLVDAPKLASMMFDHLDGVKASFVVAVIEDVGGANAAGPGGKVGAFGSGRNLGAIEATVQRFWPMHWVTPARWKLGMGLKGATKQQSIDKATALFGRAAAEEHWPLKKHEGVAEAALIGAYWLKKNSG